MDFFQLMLLSENGETASQSGQCNQRIFTDNAGFKTHGQASRKVIYIYPKLQLQSIVTKCDKNFIKSMSCMKV